MCYLTSMEIVGLFIGVLFGAGLFLSGLANPDNIIGTLRLRNFHAMRTIAMFVIVSVVGVWVLWQADLANLSIKPAVMIPVIIGGSLFGFGFGMSGFCPGTGLVCAAAGRFDALVCVVGMLLGAAIFILLDPWMMPTLKSVWDLGKTTVPETTNTPAEYWVAGIAVLGGLVLLLTKPRTKKEN